ncbi:aromatic ring-opening dioxygenase family protein [Sclerotinia borealis F-4128]|uniref:Aromatic ring-opening dioxygenase family protein n=1 Tax=Sclerotinia borealis (strain F-4128) TaxID=1432307 RepID=W9CDG0_SCLBF|nr:aromatic ring-opening dioxygenase family protein [Sclerotinia borealis F-4128]
MAPATSLTPVHFFSHGSTMMLGEESNSATYWKKCGDEALANGIKHVVIMGAHWATLGNEIEVASNPNPEKSPVAYVHPSKYVPYKLNPDIPMASRCVEFLRNYGFEAKLNDKFDWIHDTYLILIRMFPDGCPPTTIISMNARYDAHYHTKVGTALRPLRREDVLFIGTGGAVHNLYRNNWYQMLMYRDNFAMESPPDAAMLEFRQEFEDAMTKNSGPELRRALTMLMKLPTYRDAHGTDDHFMSAMFVAGLCGNLEDRGTMAVLGAEDWELKNMCNSQYTLGKWASGNMKGISAG